MRFSGHSKPGCVEPGRERADRHAGARCEPGAWQERAWRLWTAALPVGGVLVLVGTVWMLVALRRSRKHGKDFLPMILGRLF